MLEPDDKRRALQEYMAKYSGTPGPPAESMGILGSALDVITRPASAIMGGLYGAVAPEVSPLEGFMEGLRGDEYYGTYNLLTAAGMDPESRVTRGLGLVGDIVNPLDPVNYVGFGFSKVGKLANVLEHGTEALGKLPTREAAALLGHWSPLTIAGQAMGPRALNVRAARAVDAVGQKISKSETVQSLGRYFGGVRKLEAQFPSISRVIRGEERLVAADAEKTSRELTGIMDGLRAKGLKETEVEKVMRETAGLLESPEDKYFRLGREWELLDAAERGEYVQWRPDDVLDPVDLEQFKAAGKLTQQEVDKRVGELMLQRRELTDIDDYEEVLPPAAFSASKFPDPLFHGSKTGDINLFNTDPKKTGANTGAVTTRLGAFFTGNPKIAQKYAELGTKGAEKPRYLYTVKVNLRNPLDMDSLTAHQMEELERSFPGFRKRYESSDDKFSAVRMFAEDFSAPRDSPLPLHGWIKEVKGLDPGNLQPGQFPELKKEYQVVRDAWEQEVEHLGQKKLKALGYDGIVVDTYNDVPRGIGARKEPEFIVFDSKNIHTQRVSALDAKGELSERRALEDELHVLQSVQVSRLAGDLPPEYTAMMAGRKAQLSVEMGKVRELWDEASDDARDTFKLVKPLIDDTKKIYEDILRGYDAKFQFPVEDYLKHMFPVHWSRLPGSVAKKQATAEAKVQAYAAELAAKGYDEESITRMVRTNLKEESALVGAADRTESLTGDLDAFKQRQIKMTIKEVNEAAKDGTLPWAFEDHSAVIASAMRRDATRWKFGHDINKWVTEQPGWTIQGQNYAALSKAEQKNWVPMQFHLPWIDGAKNPFKGKYMAREVHELMQAQLRGVGMLTNDAGLNGIMQAMHGMRRWWTSWTLAPFPAFHVRNLASDMIQSSQAGLSPVKDLMKAPMGESAYAASMGFQMARKGLPDDRGAWKAGKASLDNLTATLSKRFGEDVTVERLQDWMELEAIVGSKGVRDLDLNAMFSKDPVYQQAMKKRSKASRAADFLPFQAPGRSPIIRAGFKAGEGMSDFTRTALFFDSLRKVAPEAKSLDQAMEYATATVRKHLFDYGDLTTFERSFMRLAMPFYTFSSKNIPLQVEKMMTDPKHLQWTARLYQGAWGQFDDTEIKPEDLPDWLEEGLGLPMQKVSTEDGQSTYAIWSPRGWLPQTELNEMADLLRGKAGTQLLARLNPALKESFEQMLNTDSYTQRQIDDGTIRDVLGVVMEDLGGAVATLAEDAGAPPGSLDSLRGKGVPNSVARRVGHLLNNFRLVTEVDKLDPGGAFTKLGQHMGWWEGERPHRFTAPGVDRGMRFFVGLNMKGVDVEQQAERNMRTALLDANAARGKMRKAYREGNLAEARVFFDRVQEESTKMTQFKQRLGNLRKRRALDVASKQSEGERF